MFAVRREGDLANLVEVSWRRGEQFARWHLPGDKDILPSTKYHPPVVVDEPKDQSWGVSLDTLNAVVERNCPQLDRTISHEDSQPFSVRGEGGSVPERPRPWSDSFAPGSYCPSGCVPQLDLSADYGQGLAVRAETDLLARGQPRERDPMHWFPGVGVPHCDRARRIIPGREPG